MKGEESFQTSPWHASHTMEPAVPLVEQVFRLRPKNPEYNGFISAEFYYTNASKNNSQRTSFPLNFKDFYLIFLWCAVCFKILSHRIQPLCH